MTFRNQIAYVVFNLCWLMADSFVPLRLSSRPSSTVDSRLCLVRHHYHQKSCPVPRVLVAPGQRTRSAGFAGVSERRTVLNQRRGKESDFIADQARIAEEILQLSEETASRELVCDDAHGICVLKDPEAPKEGLEIWKPRLLLLAVCLAYGSNFACGSIMTDSMDPSVVAGLRFSIAALALSPFLRKLDTTLLGPSVQCSVFIAMAYLGQIVALQSVPAGKVGFLCSLSVVICPLLEVGLSGKAVSRGLVASILLAVAGVGALELGDGLANLSLEAGDLWAMSQPLGFGIGYFLTERLMKEHPEQALPITAVQTATVGACSLFWMVSSALLSGATPTSMFGGLSSHPEALVALVYTGLVTTAMTRIGETVALKGLTSTDASMIMTTEPIWAAAWAWGLQGDAVGASAVAGGAFITAACGANFYESGGEEVREAEASDGQDARAETPDEEQSRRGQRVEVGASARGK